MVLNKKVTLITGITLVLFVVVAQVPSTSADKAITRELPKIRRNGGFKPRFFPLPHLKSLRPFGPKKYRSATPTPVYRPTTEYNHEPTPTPLVFHHSTTPGPTYKPTKHAIKYSPQPKKYIPTTPSPPQYTPTTARAPKKIAVESDFARQLPGGPAIKIEPNLLNKPKTVLPYHPEPKAYHSKPVLIDEEDYEGPSNYAFGYAVKDSKTGDDFSHQETRDGYRTSGEYRVALPDGRIQIVTYHADENGYHADVKYEGEAVPYVPPEYEPSYKSSPKSFHPNEIRISEDKPYRPSPQRSVEKSAYSRPKPAYNPVTPRSHALPPKRHQTPVTPKPSYPTYSPYTPQPKSTPAPVPIVENPSSAKNKRVFAYDPTLTQDEPVYKPKPDPYKAKLAKGN